MAPLPRLRVSDNRRFLQTASGDPFFYLGDTAWQLFHFCDRAEVDLYLEDRAAKNFTVIQAVALAELDGLETPNAQGDRPLLDRNPTKPNEPYWQHVDYVFARAESLGLYIGLLPTWGGMWSPEHNSTNVIFDEDNARTYGQWIGQRYGGRNVIWILGGDRYITSVEEERTIHAMGAGIRAAAPDDLITFHPRGPSSSSDCVHHEPWLDFHMIQSGHMAYRDNAEMIRRDYLHRPVRPVIDGEPAYENISTRIWGRPYRRIDHHDVRRYAYWALFAGACGHTYGCNEIWQMWKPGRASVIDSRVPWPEALRFPGSSHVQYARKLMESRSYFTRVPAEGVVPRGSNPGGVATTIATKCSEGGYVMVYTPEGTYLDDLNLKGHLATTKGTASWYNPRNGEFTTIGEIDASALPRFEPPYDPVGRDWILVIDAKS